MWIQRAMLGAVLALLGSACMSGYDTRIPPSQSPYDAVAPAQLAVLKQSPAQLLLAEWAQARASLEQAHRSEPGSIPLGIWLQEAQLAEQGLSGEAGGPISDPLRTARLDELTREWRRAAEAQPTAASYVLAARLERDPQTARVLLDRAESLDSRCPWVPYARAFLCARERDWAQVARQLQTALELEPGHL